MNLHAIELATYAAVAVAALSAVAFYLLRPGSPVAAWLDGQIDTAVTL